MNRKMDEIETSINDQAAYSRRNNTVVHGVQILKHENEIEIAKLDGDIFGVKFKDEDIDAAHRLWSTKKKKYAPPFIIKLANKFKNAQLVKQAKVI